MNTKFQQFTHKNDLTVQPKFLTAVWKSHMPQNETWPVKTGRVTPYYRTKVGSLPFVMTYDGFVTLDFSKAQRKHSAQIARETLISWSHVPNARVEATFTNREDFDNSVKVDTLPLIYHGVRLCKEVALSQQFSNTKSVELDVIRTVKAILYVVNHNNSTSH